MGFHNVQFPNDIAYGSSGGPGYKTEIHELKESGAVEFNSRWEAPRHRFDAISGVKDPEQIADLLTFFHARRGSANTFRWKDWKDYSTASNHTDTPSDTDIQIGLGDGSDTTFQLIKTYEDSVVTRTRNILLPIASTVRVSLDDVEQLSGWSVNDTTGVITFTSAPALNVVIKAGFEFDVKAYFGPGLDDLFNITVSGFEDARIQSIPIIEDKSTATVRDEVNFGGAQPVQATTAPVSITTTAKVWQFTKTSGTYQAVLPTGSLTSWPLGGEYWILINQDPSSTMSLLDETSTEIGPIPANGGTAIIYLGLASSARSWKAVVV